MRIHVITRYIGFILLFNAAFLLIAFLISLSHYDSATFPLLYSFLICTLLGLFPFIFVPAAKYISRNEGFFIVILSWLLSCLIGVLPYILYGDEFTLTNAWFESVSGFTTTGSSILKNVEALPDGLLFWRSATHWIGGIGIVIFVLVVLPNLGQARFVLLRAEQSSLAESNFKFQTGKVLQIVLYVYLGLTIAETLTLTLFGMSFFDALLHSFATIATGGFSTKNTSIAYYNSVPIEVTVIVFMILSGIHFGFLYISMIRRRFNIFSSYVVRYYIISMMLGIILVTVFLYLKGFYSFPDALRYSSFQVASAATTTGFATADTLHWAGFAQMILIFFTLQCACSGSTSGGIKVDRVVLFFKYIKTLVTKMFHPNAVIITRLDGEAVENDIIQNSLLFIALYLLIVFISALLLTALDVDMITSFSASIATMGNVGPGLGQVSSMANYSSLPDLAKWILTLNMLLGRLEIYGFMALIMWRSLK